MKRLAFTPHALARLDEILAYSTDRYGTRRAEQYLDDTAERCGGLSARTVSSQSCRAIVGGNLSADLRLARAGRHYVIFVETDSEIRVIDVIHQSANVVRRLKDLP